MSNEASKKDNIIQIVQENLKLSPKQAAHFADKARALQRNLKLRKKQKEEAQKKEQNKREK